MLKRNNLFLKINILLIVFFSTNLLSLEPYDTKAQEKTKVINIAQSQTESDSLPSSSKGRLQLNVDVADDAGIDTISELITLEHIKASEIEPFIKARLSRYGTV
ncbi:MAG: hypothetical protein AAB267_00720, partial [Candidatus Desantisbacteria bacterium]